MPAAILTALVGLSVAIPKPEAQERKIPLDQCYATFASKGVKHISNVPSEGVEWVKSGTLEGVLRDAQSGASNLFLVQGKDLEEVLRSTRRVTSSGISVDRPVKDTNVTASAPVWLVAYLGTHGNVGAWTVQSATVRDRTVRLVCPYTEPVVVYGVSFRYFVWLPLDHPPAGTYTLQLLDREDAEPYLTRRVLVGSP